MNNWLYRLEAKYGRYAIRNLPLYIVGMYVIGFALNMMTQGRIYYEYLSLNPYMILHGQPWRVVTFLLAVPSTSIIYLIFAVLFYYSIGRQLCMVWGAFKYNLYMLTGILATIVGSFLYYAVTHEVYIFMDGYYIYLSMFLAFATIFPDAMVYLYGIFPLRVKWLMYLDLIYLAIDFYRGSNGSRVAIVVSLLNFALFFFGSRNVKRYSPKEIHRKKVYHQKVKPTKAYRHQCAICKKTELDDPNLEFRYCSKCDGDFEYCNEHLFTHTHIKQ
ncbi:MAG: hypothetical protein Q4E53_09260 [Eubacteriales bacterium]|nr:hypothetical protein [Eubacteriales bacterium]